ncbi:MAG: insulinase family protein, partial [Armatimonadetes bacterium]|nr:insulinase family protein [Armatimonadota bacterium]
MIKRVKGFHRWAITTGAILLLCIAITGICSGQPIQSAQLNVLPDGIRLITLVRHNIPLVAIDVWIRAGNMNFTAQTCGVTHYIEHLIFKGTPSMKPGDLDKEIEDFGSELNAGTLRDGVHFHTVVESRYWQKALTVLGNALSNPAFRQQDIDTERPVILAELLRDHSDPRRIISDRLTELLFPGSPYGMPYQGLSATISAMSRDQIVQFYHQYYTTHRMTAVLVGDFNQNETEAAADSAFQPISSDSPSPTKAVVPPAGNPPNTDVIQLTAPEDGMSGAIGLGWKGPPAANQKEDAALDVLSEILNLPRAGRLAVAFSNQRSAPNASSRYISEREGGIFTILVTTNSDFNSVRRKILDLVGALANDKPPLPGEFFLAKQQIIGRFLYDT